MKSEKGENGICILCGREEKGLPARPDFVISSARKMRNLLHLGAKHTIACNKCLPECVRRRAVFEKGRKNYQIGAAVFFLLLVGGSVAYGAFGLRAVLAGAVGASSVFLLCYAKYFPAFEPS